MQTPTFKAAAALVISVLAAQAAVAGDIISYAVGERPDPMTVARILGERDTPAPRVKMRSIRLLADVAAPAQVAPAAEPAGERPDGLALPVQFAFDSPRIEPQATPQLDALADGIKLAGPETRVLIEGFTDAKGAEDYNLRLSLARAAAVKSYLVLKHGIDPSQLRVAGRGEEGLVDPQHPYAARNRRVEFRPDHG
jgi:outer membrane protein OmpA-like peptidoglycan-associated protein